ncbi:MAG: GMC family oxidoreductase N-terminal domain-containing protein, partial [Acidobacteriaceae bacterium]|nr:GMC family oxidoreductase N-terminal domain-containing protein [Acidobacteriaceae bacterium]
MINFRQRREWDYIIVGGGTAGCVLAARLSEQPATKVLLMEAGPEYPAVLSVPLVGLRQTTAYSWKYFTVQQPGAAYRRIAFPFGKVLGGSSSTNGMMFYRGTRAAYDRWEQLGNPGWCFSSVLPYFRKSETWEQGASEYHGGDGPVHVANPRHRARFSTAFVEACIEQGLPHLHDFNGPQQEGAGFYPVMQYRGRRAGAAPAYLAPARRRSNLDVETGALVSKLIMERFHVTGIEFQSSDGTAHRAFAAREVILSAGSLNSPKILMLSGIGPADHLRSIGIEPRCNLPGVGENLLDHVRVPVIYESRRSSPGNMIHWIPAALNYALLRQGVLASNCCESGAIVRSDASAATPDLQFVSHFQTSLHPNAVDLQFSLAHCSAPGRVRAVSADPSVPPAIDPNYFASDTDIQVAVRGVRLARQIANSPALRRFPLGLEILPGSDILTDQEIESYCRATADTSYHPVGTCKMGSNPMAVVDSELRVHGLNGLRVVDASIMPDIPSGNTCAPVLMIAEKAADLIQNQSATAQLKTRIEP